MTTAQYLMKQALDLETPQQPAAQGPGVTFHPPANGNTQGAIGEAFARGTVQPGFIEKNMPWLQTGAMGAQMLGQFTGQHQAPAGAAPAVKPAMPAAKPMTMPRRR